MTLPLGRDVFESAYARVAPHIHHTPLLSSRLIGHHVRVHDVKYLAGQIYLRPHPRELMLRNHV